MEVITGHLTVGNKKAIKAIMEKGLSEGRVSRTDYRIIKILSGTDTYMVTISKIDRGMIPCPGSELRLSHYKSTFTL